MSAPRKQRKRREVDRADRDGSAIPGEVSIATPADAALACCAQDISEQSEPKTRYGKANTDTGSYSKAFHNQHGYLKRRRSHF